MATSNLKVNQLLRKVKKQAKLSPSLFDVHKAIEYGFPAKPSSLAYDPTLSLLAVSTERGDVIVYGAPGVVLKSKHVRDGSHVVQMQWIPNQGRLVTVTRQGELSGVHLFEINNPSAEDKLPELQPVKSVSFERAVKAATSCCLNHDASLLYVGAENGDVSVIDVPSFTLKEEVIYQDQAMQNVTDDFKQNAGCVESIQPHPKDDNLLLIGYRRGLLVLWNSSQNLAHQTFYTTCQDLESVSWCKDGTHFITSHSDGSYFTWLNDASKQFNGPTQAIPYGPLECKPIGKIISKTCKSDQQLLVFSGGMPRASHGDKHAMTLMKDKERVSFELPSKVIDFITLQDVNDEGEQGDPHTLLILTEQELVAIDLQTEGDGIKMPEYPVMHQPILNPASAANITSYSLLENIDSQLLDKLRTFGKEHSTVQMSPRDWPITGGKSLESNQSVVKDVLVTGHENGTLRFWSLNPTDGFYPLHTIETGKLFANEEEQLADKEEEETEGGLVFRKIGQYDPCADDPRLAIAKIIVSPQDGSLVVAGAAGQIVSLKMSAPEDVEITPLENEGPIAVTIVDDSVPDFKWKGHSALDLKPEHGTCSGYFVSRVFQCHPPAVVTALAQRSDWNMVAVGTQHGFALLDTKKGATIVAKNTLVANDEAASGEKMSRSRSLKETVRNSFRRLRKPKPAAGEETAEDKAAAPATAEGEKQAAEDPSTSASAAAPVIEEKERRVEMRDEGGKMLASTVRCCVLCDTYLRSPRERSASLWLGTHAGVVTAYIVTLGEEPSATLAKEIKLHHRAPIVSMHIVDHSGMSVDHAVPKETDTHTHHELVVCSEEQLKLFTLPSLKGKYKEKLTAVEGVKLKKVHTIRIKQDDHWHEMIACLSNQGDVHMYSLPGLFAQARLSVLDKQEESLGLRENVLGGGGEGYYLFSTHMLKRFSYMKHAQADLKFLVELPEGCRPVPEVEEVAEPEPEKKEEKEDADGAAAVSDQPEEGAGEQSGKPAFEPVEIEARRLLDDKEQRESEATGPGGFEESALASLSPDNPEIKIVTTTTYKAVETQHKLIVEDGDRVYTKVSTTRDATVTGPEDAHPEHYRTAHEDYYVEKKTSATAIVPSEEKPAASTEVEDLAAEVMKEIDAIQATKDTSKEEDVVEDEPCITVEASVSVEASISLPVAEEQAAPEDLPKAEPEEKQAEETPAEQAKVEKAGNESDDEVCIGLPASEDLRDAVECNEQEKPASHESLEPDQKEEELRVEGHAVEAEDEVTHHIEPDEVKAEEPHEKAEEAEEKAEEPEDKAEEPEDKAEEPEEKAEEPEEKAEEPEEKAEEPEEKAEEPEEKAEEPEEKVEEAEEKAGDAEKLQEEAPDEMLEPTLAAEEPSEKAGEADEPQDKTEDEAVVDRPPPLKCYGGSKGELYSPLSRDAQSESEKPLSPKCYGGSNGELYSPLSRDALGESEKPVETETGASAAEIPSDAADTETPAENSEVPAENTDSGIPPESNDAEIPPADPVESETRTEDLNCETPADGGDVAQEGESEAPAEPEAPTEESHSRKSSQDHSSRKSSQGNPPDETQPPQNGEQVVDNEETSPEDGVKSDEPAEEEGPQVDGTEADEVKDHLNGEATTDAVDEEDKTEPSTCT